MAYTINELAKLSGVSPRTLRYYDEIGLLKPARNTDNGYRTYGPEEVNLLQQILLYRELGVQLENIKQIISTPDFDIENALEMHLATLFHRKTQIEMLIENVRTTISTIKGETPMSDREKFSGFTHKLVTDNEAAYGEEVRKQFGDQIVDASNEKIKGMSDEQWQKAQELSTLINRTLREAFEQGDPSSEIAQKVCGYHKEWLCLFWPEGMYTKEAHKALAEGYVADERFTAYYDKIAEGCTKFLRDSIQIYCS